MEITVLIAAYQANAYIAPALRSLATQTHSAWSLVVVEDGSDDGLAATIAAFAAAHPLRSVVYHQLGQNQGVATARSTLLRLATGDAIAFLDADDHWAPTHLAAAATALAASADLVVAGIHTFDLTTGTTLQDYPAPPPLLVDPVAALFTSSVIITSSAVVLRRSLALKVGPFDPQLRVGEDRDYWLRCALAGARFAHAPFTCYYAKHEGSTMAKALLVAEHAHRFALKYRQHPGLAPTARRHALARASLDYARLLRATAPRRSVRLALEAWSLRPLNPHGPLHLVLSLLHLLRSYLPAARS
jgi:glycosyltransferase involved in cell wall biosynthesis